MNDKTRPVCFITGASSGIGAALAIEYAKDGYSLAIVGRRLSKLEEVSDRAQQLDQDCEVLIFEANVEDATRVKECFNLVGEKFSRLDVVIANAGYVVGGKFEEITLEDYKAQFDTNVYGVLNTIYPSLGLLKRSKGRLAIVGSVNSYLAIPSVSAYAMSKYAVRALAEAIYYEFKPLGVTVTMICPGFVKSDIRIRNNQGEIITGKEDLADRFAMNTGLAARKIKRAIDKRKKESVITFHGKVAVWLKRFFPGLIFLVFSLQRRKPKT